MKRAHKKNKYKFRTTLSEAIGGLNLDCLEIIDPEKQYFKGVLFLSLRRYIRKKT